MVLVVDDDDTQRELTTHLLEREGWQVITAGNGSEALEKMSQTSVELILLDLLMPEMDGFEFVAVLKQNPAWKDIPVVVLTSKDITGEDRQRLNGRVQRIISKGSLDAESFLEQIRRVVGPSSPD